MEKKNSKNYSVGIDVGSVSLNCIVIDKNKEIIFESAYKRHFGKIDEEILSLVETLFQKFGEKQIQSISFTGSHGKKFAEKLDVFYEFETFFSHTVCFSLFIFTRNARFVYFHITTILII